MTPKLQDRELDAWVDNEIDCWVELKDRQAEQQWLQWEKEIDGQEDRANDYD